MITTIKISHVTSRTDCGLVYLLVVAVLFDVIDEEERDEHRGATQTQQAHVVNVERLSRRVGLRGRQRSGWAITQAATFGIVERCGRVRGALATCVQNESYQTVS